MDRTTVTLENPRQAFDFPGLNRYDGTDARALFLGVRLPRSVPFFDCRSSDDWAGRIKAHYGETLWSGERAAYALGLRQDWGARHDSTPVSTSFYFDARKPENAEDTAKVLRGLRKTLADYWRQYRRAKRSRRKNTGQGGSAYYRPAAIELSNYGAGLICDERECVVELFAPLPRKAVSR